MAAPRGDQAAHWALTRRQPPSPNAQAIHPGKWPNDHRPRRRNLSGSDGTEMSRGLSSATSPVSGDHENPPSGSSGRSGWVFRRPRPTRVRYDLADTSKSQFSLNQRGCGKASPETAGSPTQVQQSRSVDNDARFAPQRPSWTHNGVDMPSPERVLRAKFPCPGGRLFHVDNSVRATIRSRTRPYHGSAGIAVMLCAAAGIGMVMGRKAAQAILCTRTNDRDSKPVTR